TMTPDAKRALSTTIRGLRQRLLEDLHAATERAYRLSIRARDAGLTEAAKFRRSRLEAWVSEELRGLGGGPGKKAGKGQTAAAENPAGAAPARGLHEVNEVRRGLEKRAAYTLLNRLVFLKLLEAPRPPKPGESQPRSALLHPAVVTGGWDSRAYKDFRSLAADLCRGGRLDETEGYDYLLRLTFDELATELPGLFGKDPLIDLIPVPPATLRAVITALDDTALETCWTDDMTLGWVYQYWNDPEREALDDKLNAGGKLLGHELASKTQMFTERYMVDWLLQNSLGPMWLAICQKHGWTADILAPSSPASVDTPSEDTPSEDADSVDARFIAPPGSPLDTLEKRRADWRKQRQAGEVELTALLPLHTDLERRWAYYVPQPIPDEAVQSAPDSLKDLRLIDPAVGSGHFLVVALDLLFGLAREEARHRRLVDDPAWSDRALVEHILAHTLHGVDLDPRAVQIAAAALWLKARHLADEARPSASTSSRRTSSSRASRRMTRRSSSSGVRSSARPGSPPSSPTPSSAPSKAPTTLAHCSRSTRPLTRPFLPGSASSPRRWRPSSSASMGPPPPNRSSSTSSGSRSSATS
ncbi:MAG TPA: hypothetical protein PK095_18070, partial [Myxococcota bacterium]|nr:hypothetical protein [Myxococcota bacterium]